MPTLLIDVKTEGSNFPSEELYTPKELRKILSEYIDVPVLFLPPEYPGDEYGLKIPKQNKRIGKVKTEEDVLMYLLSLRNIRRTEWIVQFSSYSVLKIFYDDDKKMITFIKRRLIDRGFFVRGEPGAITIE